MRKFFWAVVLVGLLALLFGLWSPLPLHPGVTATALAEQFRSTAFYSAVCGALLGLLGGVLARGRLRHRPREAARSFLDRVGAWGVGTQVVAVVFAVGVAWARAATVPLGPLAPNERVALLLVTGRALLPLGLALLAASLTYVLAAYARAWGGQYALAPWVREVEG